MSCPECEEQARLLGISGSRELHHLSRIREDRHLISRLTYALKNRGGDKVFPELMAEAMIRLEQAASPITVADIEEYLRRQYPNGYKP